MNQTVSQIKFDKKFIKKLLEKLKVGNTRSIHLNAIPGRSATRLDISALSEIEKNIPKDFIETILNNESFSFSVSYDKVNLSNLEEEEKRKLVLISKRLNTLVIENNDNFLEFGLKNFGFGFPLLIKRDRNDPSKIIKAPLFIWHLDIERSYQHKNTWTIKKDEDSLIKINELLISHLSKDESVKIEKISKEVLEDGVLDKNELLELCQNILSQLSSKSENLRLKVEKCPDTKQIEAIANSKPWIQWSGIFGIYRSQKETIIQNTEELLERFQEFESEDLILEKFQTSTISAIETDPSKEEIINTLMKDEIKLIQGPPGTGKSQSIAAIISNALANNSKCLVVCEKKTALDVIQANLKKIGLDDFSIVIDDVNKDRKKIIEKARNINDHQSRFYFSKLDFEEKYKKFCLLKEELNKKYAEPLKKVFGDFSWKQLIGLYLQYSKYDDFHSTVEKLNYDFLKFNHEEYSKKIDFVEEVGLLYSDLEKDSEKTFFDLNQELFSIKYKWGTHKKVKDETEAFLGILESINLFLAKITSKDCEEKGVSLFNPKSVEQSEKFVTILIKNLENVLNLQKEGTAINEKKLNELLKILKPVKSFLSEKNQDDCEEKKVSIFNPKSIKDSQKHLGVAIKNLEMILDLHKKGISLIGKNFNEKNFWKGFKLNFSSLFNQKSKKACRIRKEIPKILNATIKVFLEIKKFNFEKIELKSFKENETFKDVQKNVLDVLEKLKKINLRTEEIQKNGEFLQKIETDLKKSETDKIFEFKILHFADLGNFKKVSQFYSDLHNYVSKIKNDSVIFSAFFKQSDKNVFKIKEEMPKSFNMMVEAILELKKFNFENIEFIYFNKNESFESLKNNALSILKNAEKIKLKIEKIKRIDKTLRKTEADLIKIKSNNIFNIVVSNHIDLEKFNTISEYYSDIYKRIHNLKNHLDSYESYHNWMFFCSSKDEFELQILSALKNALPENWNNFFKAWYYQGALLKYEENSDVGFHKSDKRLLQLAKIYDELGDEQIDQIESIWNDKRNRMLSSVRFNFNTLYNFRKNKVGPRNSLRKIIETDFDLFTTLFPIILINPGAANAILPLKQGLFTIVIFDESSQLRIADTFTSLIRGQYKIIAGDEHQMPPSNYFQSTVESLDLNEDDEEISNEDYEQEILAESESLLQYANDLPEKTVNKSSLDFHYRSNHPALIEFSNHAFYGGNLIPFPAQEVYKPIEFRAVNGLYELRTNPAEIAEVLKIIQEEIHPDQKGKYPSVGIATFNINQRNLITEALNEAAEKDPLFAKKLQELREKGLFVKNLENIQGDEKDIIIISTTYGIKSDGKFTQNFSRLNRIEGYKLLNVLITRAKRKLYVCASIPKEKYISYPEMIKNEGNNKKGILYAYLAYAEAISNHDNELANKILKLLKEQSLEKPNIISHEEGLSESPFEEEVYESLLDHIEKKDIIQQHRVGGFRLDFVIKTKIRDVVLECDGKAYHQSEEAYAHDMYRQKELEKMGFIVYRIWSTNWFQDKEIEIQKLLKFIEKISSKKSEPVV